MQKLARTCRASNFKGEEEFEVGSKGENGVKNGFIFFNQDVAIENASLTSLREGRMTNISSETLKHSKYISTNTVQMENLKLVHTTKIIKEKTCYKPYNIFKVRNNSLMCKNICCPFLPVYGSIKYFEQISK